MRRLYIDRSGALYLERASRFILGSQIDALRFLSMNASANKEQLRTFYMSAAASNPTFFATFPFEQWLNFLAAWNLVSVESDTVRLTAAGTAIVPYMQTWGYLNFRPGG